MNHLDEQIELLRILLEATRTGTARWRRDEADSYCTELAELQCAIRFKHPLMAGEDGSDADAVEVTVDLSVLTFYTGSTGFDLVGEILAAAYPELNEHRNRLESNLKETIERLRNRL